MENKIMRNIIKTIIIYPIVIFIGLPIVFIFSDFSLKESYNDLFKNFFD